MVEKNGVWQNGCAGGDQLWEVGGKKKWRGPHSSSPLLPIIYHLRDYHIGLKDKISICYPKILGVGDGGGKITKLVSCNVYWYMYA